MAEIDIRTLIDRRSLATHRQPLRVLGIDLGTTNSVVAEALWEPSSPERAVVRCLEIDQATAREGIYTSSLVPSVVTLFEGREFVGEGAKRLVALAGELGLRRNRDFFFESKNEIGTSKRYAAAPDGYQSPTEIGGRILARLVAGAEGVAPEKIVVTVPASFQIAQRHETVAAARRAGIEIADGHLMDEPIAAFMDYVAVTGHTLDLPEDREANLLVFDFGGGTCDVAIFKISRQGKEFGLGVAPSSISRFHRLGGGDIDAAIVYEVLIPQLAAQNNLRRADLNFTRKKQFVEPTLRGIAESLKIGLSREIMRLRSLGRDADDSVEKVFPGQKEIVMPDRRLVLDKPLLPLGALQNVLSQFLDPYQQAPVTNEYRTARSIFAPIEDALTRAGLKPEDIDFCLLAGGSSGLPQIVDALNDYLPEATMLHYDEDEERKTTIARGAALQALSLALAGKPLVHPMCQDSVAILTDAEPIELIPRGASLPFPEGGGFAMNDHLAVPTSSEDAAVTMRVEVVAGQEHRTLFSQPWEVTAPVSRGEPLRLDYRLDANQVLELQLRKRDAPRSEPFITRIENPLTHVVNPAKREAEADELERQIGPGNRLPQYERYKIGSRLSNILQELGQREKALDILVMLQREAGRPDSAILNRMALLLDEMNAPDEAENRFHQAIDATPQDIAAHFNLALLLRRQSRMREAAEIMDKLISYSREPPHLVLRAQIASNLRDNVTRDDLLRQASAAFGAIEDLDLWELHWLDVCAEMMGDRRRMDDVKREQQRRAQETHTTVGDLPMRKPEG